MANIENLVKREKFYPCILERLERKEVSQGEKQVLSDYCSGAFQFLLPAIVLTFSFSYILNFANDLYLSK